MAAVVTNPSLIPGRGPTPVDAEIGKRIRMRRLLLGMNQKTLAGALGVCSQQVNKYEHGINRVGPSRLTGVADALGVPISYFFDNALAPTSSPHMPPDLMERPETLQLMRLYYAIRDETVRHQALEIVKAIAEATASRPVTLMRKRGRPPAAAQVSAGGVRSRVDIKTRG